MSLLGIQSAAVAAVVAVAGGGIGLAAWWLRRRSIRRRAGEDLAAYQEQVVAYSDAMDQLQERHKMLPFTDPDYIKPMAGQTLATYAAVEQAVQAHRDHWLELMDVWDRCKKLLEEGQSSEVSRLVAQTDVAARRARLQQECSHPLDRLEAAHQDVDHVGQQIKDLLALLETRIGELAAASLATDAFAARSGELQEARDQGLAVRDEDPLEAIARLELVRDDFEELQSRAAGVLEQSKRRAALEARIAETTELSLLRRREGLLMAEVEGDPDPLLAEARRSVEAAADLLNRADPDHAGQQLEAAHARVEQAHQIIEFQAQFQSTCQDLLRRLRLDLERLRDAIRQAESQLQRLEQEHDPRAWRQVDGNLPAAREAALRLDELLGEAERAVDPQRQRYFRARGIMDEVERRRPEAAELVAEIGRRLEELEGLRRDGRRQLDDLWQESARLESLLRRSDADRPQSNFRYDAARRSLEELRDRANQRRADWVEIHRELERVKGDLETVDRMANEDFLLAQQAEAEIREAELEIRRCRSFYQAGVSPQIGQAEGQVASAADALRRQDYERAIELANAAEAAARAALDAARQIVEQREAEVRRRRAADTALQVASVVAVAAAQAAAQIGANRRRQ